MAILPMLHVDLCNKTVNNMSFGLWQVCHPWLRAHPMPLALLRVKKMHFLLLLYFNVVVTQGSVEPQIIHSLCHSAVILILLIVLVYLRLPHCRISKSCHYFSVLHLRKYYSDSHKKNTKTLDEMKKTLGVAPLNTGD